MTLGLIAASFVTGASLSVDPFSITYPGPHGLTEFWHAVFSHGAVAVIVATIVSESVERSARKRFELDVKNMMENTIGGLSRTIFKTIYSDRVIEECIDSIFSSTLVRGPFTYEVTLDRVVGLTGVIRKTDILDYTIHNTSGIDASYSPKYMMDNNVGIFKHDDGFDKPRITFCQFGKKVFEQTELDALNEQVSDGIEANVEMGTFLISARKSMNVRIEVTKIEPDRWIAPMRIFVPTSDIRVEINNLLGDDLVVYVSSMSRLGFGDKELHGANPHRWHRSLEGLVLPGGGWVIGWFRPQERISTRSAN